MQQFLEQLFGTTDLPTYVAWFILAFMGAFAGVLIRAQLKYKKNSDTPEKWSWGFLFKDNSLGLVIGFFITFIFIRFSSEMLNMEPTASIREHTRQILAPNLFLPLSPLGGGLLSVLLPLSRRPCSPSRSGLPPCRDPCQWGGGLQLFP